MRSYTHTINNTQAQTSSSTTSETVNVSGTNIFTFALSGLDQQYSGINKVYVNYPDVTSDVIYRSLTTSDVSSISSNSFEKIIESEPLSAVDKPITFTMLRDDGIEDIHTVTVSITSATLDTYTDINLIKTDLVTNDSLNNNLLLTFNTDDFGITGLNNIELDTISNEVLNVGFNPETISNVFESISAEISFNYSTIFYNSDRPAKALAIRSGNNSELVKIKFRTRVPSVTAVTEYQGGSAVYAPAIPNTTFFHTSGFLVWHPNSLEQVKSISIPIIDPLGTKVLSAETSYGMEYDIDNIRLYHYFDDTTVSLSGSYFFIDLFDIDACDTVICSSCSTLTAYINY